MTEPTNDPEVLRRRVERERAARLEAEAIAERGLRSLYEINQDLDRRVQERVRESERLARQAERAERVKSEFLANVSHELRTPLMAVVGALDVLQADGGTDEEYLSVAVAGAARLRELVDELFEIVGMDGGPGRIDRTPVDVAAFVDRLGARWRMPALQAGLLLVTAVEASPGTTADLDVDRVERALDRLIDNAIEHSESGTVTLGVGCGPDEVVFTVADQGPGIEQDRVESLLEPFELGDPTSTRTHQGAGLGLTLARGLIEMMDGRIRIESVLGVGTTVVVTLPTRSP